MKHLKEISIVVLMFGAEFYLFQANSHSAINVFRGINWDLVFWAVFLPFFLASYIMTYIHDLFVALKVEEENDIKGSFIVGLLIFAILLWWNCATVFTKDQFDAVSSPARPSPAQAAENRSFPRLPRFLPRSICSEKRWMKRLPNSTNISMTLISPICRVSALSTEKERAHCGKAFTIICAARNT